MKDDTHTLNRENIDSNTDKTLDVEKRFGLGVLLKLTKQHVEGIEITTQGDRFNSNVSVTELSQAVDSVLKTHNIRLEIDD